MYLRRASTTIKTTLSKIAGGAAASNSAKPGSMGLWGKNPDAKIAMARGINALAIRIAHLGFTDMIFSPSPVNRHVISLVQGRAVMLEELYRVVDVFLAISTYGRWQKYDI